MRRGTFPTTHYKSLEHSLCQYGDKQAILPLPPTASRSSQRLHHSVDHPTYHCPKIKETVAD